MILEPPKIKSVTVSTISPSICHEVVGLVATFLVFLMLSKGKESYAVIYSTGGGGGFKYCAIFQKLVS